MAKKAPTKKAPVKSAPSKAAPKKAAPAKTAKKAAPAAKPEKIGLKDLQAEVAGKLTLVGRATVDKVVEATFASITDAVVGGKIVAVKDFGKFEVKHREARTGRNPATGEAVEIEAKTVPKFTFAKTFKEAALGA